MPIDSCLKFSWDFSWDLNCLSRTPAWQRNNISIMKYKNVKNWPFDPEQLVAIYKFKYPYVGRPALCDVHVVPACLSPGTKRLNSGGCMVRLKKYQQFKIYIEHLKLLSDMIVKEFIHFANSSILPIFDRRKTDAPLVKIE